MNSIEITTKLDNRGKVSIPKRFFSVCDVEYEDRLKLTATPDGISLKPLEKKCTLCGGKEKLRQFKSRYICTACRNETIRLFS